MLINAEHLATIVKKPKIKISKRLQKIANFAQKDFFIVDLGVDSGNLDIFIAQNSKNLKKIFAIEEKQKPFDNLISNINFYDVKEKIVPFLIDHIPNKKFDCLIIAGLGCYTIFNVLKRFGLSKLKNKHLILGPQGTQLELFILKRRLSSFFNVKTELIEEKGKLYEIWDLTRFKRNINDFSLMFSFDSENEIIKKKYISLKRKEIKYYLKFFDRKTFNDNSFEEFKKKEIFERLNDEN